MQFNQDSSCFVYANTSKLRHGFSIYSCSPFNLMYKSSEESVIAHAEMLFSTSLVAVSKHGETDSPRRLAIINTKKTNLNVICELTFPLAIRRIRLNRQRLAVATDHQICIYNIENMKLLHTIESKLSVVNNEALVDLSTSPKTSILAYSSSQSEPGMPDPQSLTPESKQVSNSNKGIVCVFDCITLSEIARVSAHKTSLAYIKLNCDGTLLATASHKGTLIRVFSVPSGELINEFRRGSRPTHIHSLSFSMNSQFVAVSSSSRTIHIYKLGIDQNSMNKRTFFDKGENDFAYCRLPESAEASKVAIQPVTNKILVLTTNKFYEFQMNDTSGGKCQLTQTHDLD